MIKINEKTFEYALTEFKNILEKDTTEKLVEFKTNSFINEHENYKYAVLEQAKNSLLTKTWKEDEIGNGRILKSVKDSIQTNVIYNYETHQNNLIDWRKKDNFSKLKANQKNEKLLFEFFKSKIKDEKAFNQFTELGFSYQLIAYLFFIKNSQKYLPISQTRFDLIFSSLNIDLKTSHNSSWENYQEFVGIIKQFQNYLKTKFSGIELLDAHSFLWIYGFQFEKSKENTEVRIQSKKTAEKKKPELPNYQPRKAIDLETLVEPETEIDYIKQLEKQMEIGNLAEEIVLKNEIEFLRTDYPDLAKKVRSVANNPKLGFDIISFEIDRTQKQIEVKAISTNKSNKSFFLSRNEFRKSKEYPNYYLYCVSELSSEKPKILRIKQPNFENENDFKMEPMTYKITFE
ncbi:DUF3883 domain-containing protein [Tamlana crocina]|uniref:DUF3883 domain-containing protein n=1 Tax=Tamlana crocina TaxID=393006 RepID=A0ABX1DET1_9FLAO|nr:DUF3883 domain-containing protein [Tamlana crocina]NJX16856.1 DUF3883 domain-containing protein [Tamlana crocina]